MEHVPVTPPAQVDQSTLVVPPPYSGPALPYAELVDHARATLPTELPANPREVMIALDVDGTLLTAAGASENVKRNVAEAIEAGLNVVIATGRGLTATRPVFSELDLESGFSISSNGAQTVRWTRAQDGRHVYERISEVFFDPRKAAEEILKAVPGSLIAVDDGQERMRVSQFFPVGELAAAEEQHDLSVLLGSPTIRMVARAPWMEREEFASALAQADLSEVECAVGWTSWADITGPGTTKARGLDALASELGVSPQGTIAIGDGTNDIAMLKWAAHGVAMGVAEPEVAAAANATTGAVDHDGAAAVIEALLERY